MIIDLTDRKFKRKPLQCMSDIKWLECSFVPGEDVVNGTFTLAGGPNKTYHIDFETWEVSELTEAEPDCVMGSWNTCNTCNAYWFFA
jgi:hypothetical protein